MTLNFFTILGDVKPAQVHFMLHQHMALKATGAKIQYLDLSDDESSESDTRLSKSNERKY